MAQPTKSIKYKDLDIAVPENLQLYSPDYLTKMLDTTGGTFEDRHGVAAYMANNPYTTSDESTQGGTTQAVTDTNPGNEFAQQKAAYYQLASNGEAAEGIGTTTSAPGTANLFNRDYAAEFRANTQKSMERVNAFMANLNANKTPATTGVEETAGQTEVTVGGGATQYTPANVALGYGNYQNFAGLSRKQRRFAATQGFKYVGSDGQAHELAKPEGMSDSDWQKQVKELLKQEKNAIKTDRKRMALGMGSATKFENDDARRIYEAGLNNPKSEYITYSEAQKPSNTGAGSGTPQYRYDFSGNSWGDENQTLKSGVGQATFDLMNQLSSQQGWLGKYAENGVINNNSMTKWVNDTLGTTDFNGVLTDDILGQLVGKGAIKQDFADSHKLTPATTGAGSSSAAGANASGPKKTPKGVYEHNGEFIILNDDNSISTVKKDGANVSTLSFQLMDWNSLSPDIQQLLTVPSNKLGGKMFKFQAGGNLNQAQVAQEQATQQQSQLTEIFQAIAAKPKETLMMLQQQGIQPKQIIELAQKMADKNPAAREALMAVQQMSQMAQQGTKLQYIKRLRGECPEGFEMQMFKAGGQICHKCVRIAMAKCGKKLEKGGESETVQKFKEMRCGGKTKKKEDGGSIPVDKCGGKTKKKCETGGALLEKCGGKTKKKC